MHRGNNMALDVSISMYKAMMILRFKGEMDESNIIQLREKITEYIKRYGINHLVLNVSKLSFIDSSGIGFIIGRYHQLREKNGKITIVGINDKLEKIIRYSGLLKICSIRDTEENLKLLEGVYD